MKLDPIRVNLTIQAEFPLVLDAVSAAEGKLDTLLTVEGFEEFTTLTTDYLKALACVCHTAMRLDFNQSDLPPIELESLDPADLIQPEDDNPEIF